MTKHQVWYIPPERHTRAVFRPEVIAALRERYDLRETEGERRITAEEVADRAPEYDAIVTGWGSPSFPDDALRRAERLRIVLIDRAATIGPELGPGPRPEIEAALEAANVELRLCTCKRRLIGRNVESSLIERLERDRVSADKPLRSLKLGSRERERGPT